MHPTSEFIKLLRCPTTGNSLSLHDKQLIVEDSELQYPTVNGVPWLIANPHNSLMDWGIKLNHFHQVLSQEISLLQNELEQASQHTQERLNRLLNGKTEFLQQVVSLVSPVLSAKVAAKEVYDSLNDRAPSTQNLLSYEANLYRDWVWGDEENKSSLDIVLKHFQPISSGEDNLLVLGAGSCRLAFDLHQSIEPNMTVATDINPLLLLSADNVFSGSSFDLYEFPMHPRNTGSVAINQTIHGLPSWPKNLHLLFADAVKPALKGGMFNCILTPWLVDIQPYELGKFLKAVNFYLPEGGQWINFGSLVFNQRRDAHCYSIDEIRSVAAESGFEVENISEHEMPYLKSPHNAGYRMERVWSWRAIKVKNLDLPVDPQPLPEWLLDFDKPVPVTREFQSFAFTHKMYADLTGMIDGQSSIQRISRKLAKQNNIDKNEALQMVKNFYLKVFLETI